MIGKWSCYFARYTCKQFNFPLNASVAILCYFFCVEKSYICHAICVYYETLVRHIICDMKAGMFLLVFFCHCFFIAFMFPRKLLFLFAVMTTMCIRFHCTSIHKPLYAFKFINVRAMKKHKTFSRGGST